MDENMRQLLESIVNKFVNNRLNEGFVPPHIWNNFKSENHEEIIRLRYSPSGIGGGGFLVFRQPAIKKEMPKETSEHTFRTAFTNTSEPVSTDIINWKKHPINSEAYLFQIRSGQVFKLTKDNVTECPKK